MRKIAEKPVPRRGIRPGSPPGAAAVLVAAALCGCDLGYLSEDYTAAAGSGTGGATSTGGSGGAAGTTGGAAAGGATTSAGGTGGAGGAGGGGGPSALAFSRGFGDPETDENPLLSDPYTIRVVAMSGGKMLVAFHSKGTNVAVGDEAFSCDNLDLFLAVVGPDGAVLQSRHVATGGDQTLRALAAAGPDGPFYVGGRTTGALDLPELAMPAGESGSAGYVLRIEPDLSVSAVALFMGANYQSVHSLFAEPGGDVWVGGQTRQALGAWTPDDVAGEKPIDSCQAPEYVPVNGKSGGFVARMTADLSACPGDTIWSFGPAPGAVTVDDVDIAALLADVDHNLYLGGRFRGKMKVTANGPLLDDDDDGGFVARASAAGDSDWAVMFRSSGSGDAVRALAFVDGALLAAGQGGTSAQFHRFTTGGAFKDEPCLPKTPAESMDGTLALLAPDTGACSTGGRLSAAVPADPSTESVRAAAALQDGEIWITGPFEKVLLVDGEALAPPLNTGKPIESFLLRFAKGGLAASPPAVPFAQAWSGEANQVARDLAVLTDGRVAVTGSYTGSIPGGAPALPVAGNAAYDYFLLVVDPTLPPVQF